MHRILVFLFSMLVIVYILATHTKMLTSIMLLFSLLCLAYVASFKKPTYHETYVNVSPEPKWVPISVEEDISLMEKGLKFYVTSFNKSSYPDYGRVWRNVAPVPDTPDVLSNCTTEPVKAEPSRLMFDINPVFSRKNGFYLGNNRLIGPLSSDIGIQFHNTFTLMFMVKFGNLIPGNLDTEIEIIKLYANSSNNNALTLYIRKNSLQLVNNVQMGQLMFQFADLPAMECHINKNDSLMTFDKDIVMLFYIVKDIDSIRIIQMTEKSNTIVNKLLKLSFTNDDVTFSNKEMVINRQANLNANIFNFAVFNYAMSDDEVTKTFNNLMVNYLKEINQSYGDTVTMYNNAVDYIKQINACPIDNTACSTCGDVGDWCGATNTILANKECRVAISNYCTANPKHDICKCWNKDATYYNSDACKKYRSIFMENPRGFFDDLSIDDIEYIKKRFKLIGLEDCPKDIKKRELGKNEYQDYSLDKLKVNVDTGLAVPKIKQVEKTNTSDPHLQELMIQRPNKALEITPDLYVTDPNIIKDHIEERDDGKCRDKELHTTFSRIKEVPRGAPLIPVEQEVPPEQVEGSGQVVTDIQSLNKRPDSFFNKFMKVMVGVGN
jgi:hypothetical protein